MRIKLSNSFVVETKARSLSINFGGEVVLDGVAESDEYRALLSLLTAVAWRPTGHSWKLQQMLPVEVERDLGTACCVIGESWTAYVKHPEKRGRNVCIDLLMNNGRLVRVVVETTKSRERIEELFKSLLEAGWITDVGITN